MALISRSDQRVRPHRPSRLAVLGLLVFTSVALLPGLGGGSVAHATDPNENYIDRVYNDFLGRDPDDTEVASGESYLGTHTDAQLVTTVFQGREFENAWIYLTHFKYVGAGPTSTQFGSEYSALNSTHDYLQTELTVLSGADYYSAAGGTNGGFVSKIYTDILYRTADPSGLSYWTNILNTAAHTRSYVAQYFIRSTEGSGVRVAGPSSMTTCTTTDLTDASSLQSGSYCLLLKRMADSSGKTYWTGQLSGTAQLPTLWDSLASSSEYYTLAQS